MSVAFLLARWQGPEEEEPFGNLGKGFRFVIFTFFGFSILRTASAFLSTHPQVLS
jgi:hypothetical protein